MSNLLVYRPGAGNRRSWCGIRTEALSVVALIVLVSLLHPGSFNGTALHTSEATAATLATPSRSTTIALTSDEKRLVVVNREANSVSIIQVKDDNGLDVAIKLDEIAVDLEPRCVAVHPNDEVAYVTNGISATVSVVDLVLGQVVRNVPTGTEPRGCALTPNGNLLYVANHTEGTVSLFFTGNPLNPIPVGAVLVGRIPPPLRSRITATTTTRTKPSSSHRSSPNSTLTRRPAPTAKVRRAISGNKGSSRPSRRAMPIRRSPKSP